MYTYYDALGRYKKLAADERGVAASDIKIAFSDREEFVCVEPMLDAMDKTPYLKYLFAGPCSDLKTGGSQGPLFDDGFGYTAGPDNHLLFRRDFYGNSRYVSPSVGAFQ